jgi:aryl-alcohol dehydrogenase-like predicted oxidoreductase
MTIRTMGSTSMAVSAVGLGLWGMGSWSGSDDNRNREVLRHAIASGCTFFDSAFVYGNGYSDTLLGAIAAEHADRPLILASKIPPADFKWPSSPNNALHAVFPRAHVLDYADRIRRAFGRPIDLLQFHVWEDVWAREAEWRETVAQLKSSGTIRAFGLSLNRWQPENGLAAIETGLVDAVQVIYNVFDQSPEDRLFPLCRARNIGVIARVPLDEGSLGGKLTLETRFPENDWRSGYFNPVRLAETVRRVEELKKELPDGMSLPELALRFILSEPAVSTAIAGMRTREHVQVNLAVADKGPLPDDLIARLRAHRWNR